MDIGVRELKQRLSELLDLAEQGEVIRVTDRGRPKAMLIGVGDGDPLQRGVDEGWVRAPVRSGSLSAVRGWRSSARVLDALSQDRDEA